MKKFLFLMATSVLVVGVASANSFTEFCGTVGSNAGVSTFIGGVTTSGSGGTASVNGAGLVTFVCNGWTVPLGITMSGIDVDTVDDAEGPLTSTSIIQWTWNYTGGLALSPGVTTTVNQESSTGLSFGSCTTNSGNLQPCDGIANFNLLSAIVGPGSTGPFTFTVSSAAFGSGGGVNPGGNTSASLALSFTYANSAGTPEPMTMMLVGGGLLGVGLLASKRRKKA